MLKSRSNVLSTKKGLLQLTLYFATTQYYPEALLKELPLKFDIRPDTANFKSQFSDKYQIEEHEVTTEDGYIQQLMRINLVESEKRKLAPEYQKNVGKVVYIQHGLFGYSGQLFYTQEASIGFHLINRGFDVWAGNERGNMFSSRHVNTEIRPKDFYKFTFDDTAAYDVPSVYKHILTTTKVEKLAYVGYSLGTTIFFAAASNEKHHEFINSTTEKFIGIAPTVYLANTSKPVRFMASFVDFATWLFHFLDINRFFPKKISESPTIPIMLKFMTDNFMPIMKNIIPSVPINLDYDVFYDDAYKVQKHYPAGTSVWNFLHYLQISKHQGEGKFVKFDYGYNGNMAKYGQPKPPAYDVSKTKTEIHLQCGELDYISQKQDVEDLVKDLPLSQVKTYWFENFSHMTFIFARKPQKLLQTFDDILL